MQPQFVTPPSPTHELLQLPEQEVWRDVLPDVVEAESLEPGDAAEAESPEPGEAVEAESPEPAEVVEAKSPEPAEVPRRACKCRRRRKPAVSFPDRTKSLLHT